MERLLAYKNLAKKEYLDGRYFNLVFKDQPGLVRKPLVIRVTQGETRIVTPDLGFRMDPETEFYIIRVILEVGDNEGRTLSRHSNVVIIDNILKRVLRFEPLSGISSPDVNKVISATLRPFFKGYFYVESSAHPQTLDAANGLCVAYIIKFTAFYLAREAVVFEGEL